jgi:hypothetical protein
MTEARKAVKEGKGSEGIALFRSFDSSISLLPVLSLLSIAV